MSYDMTQTIFLQDKNYRYSSHLITSHASYSKVKFPFIGDQKRKTKNLICKALFSTSAFSRRLEHDVSASARNCPWNLSRKQTTAWWIHFALGLPLVLVLLIIVGGIFFLPETPNHLIEWGLNDEARKVL